MEVIYELTAQYDSRKSFYGKAMTDGFNLWSYKTLVASFGEPFAKLRRIKKIENYFVCIC